MNQNKIKDKPPSEYMKIIKEKNNCLDRIMKTHLIGPINNFGIWENDYNKFLRERADLVSAKLKSFITPRDGDIINDPDNVSINNKVKVPNYQKPEVSKSNNFISYKLDGKDYTTDKQYEILENTCEFLIKVGKLNSNSVPISSGGIRYIVNSKPVHSNGTDFKAPKKLSNGLYLETSNNKETTIKYAKFLLEEFGYPNNTLEVQ